MYVMFCCVTTWFVYGLHVSVLFYSVKRSWHKGNRLCLSCTASGGSCTSTSRWWMLWCVSWEQKERTSAGQQTNCVLETAVMTELYELHFDILNLTGKMMKKASLGLLWSCWTESLSLPSSWRESVPLCFEWLISGWSAWHRCFCVTELISTLKVCGWFCDSDKPHYNHGNVIRPFSYGSRPCIVLQPLTHRSVEEQARHGADADISRSWNRKEGQGENLCNYWNVIVVS